MRLSGSFFEPLLKRDVWLPSHQTKQASIGKAPVSTLLIREEELDVIILDSWSVLKLKHRRIAGTEQASGHSQVDAHDTPQCSLGPYLKRHPFAMGRAGSQRGFAERVG